MLAFVQVVDIMRVNVDKVLERDQKLSELDDRADALQAGASQFETSAAKLKRKYWWKNCKVIFFYLVLTLKSPFVFSESQRGLQVLERSLTSCTWKSVLTLSLKP